MQALELPCVARSRWRLQVHTLVKVGPWHEEDGSEMDDGDDEPQAAALEPQALREPEGW